MGNPAARHSLGEEARESLRAARTKVGRLVGGRPDGVVFLSGATEANNLAIKGIALRGPGRHVVTTAVEHPSILVPCQDLVNAGFEVSAVAVDAEGRVSPDDVRRALRADTCLVALGAANRESGAVQPWKAVAAVTREAGVPLHVDAVGVLGRLPIAVAADGVDLLTVSANDLYGPPGVGALWVRPGLRLAPQLLGGGQEGGMRSGTENLAGAVGLGVAAEFALREGAAEAASTGDPPRSAGRWAGRPVPFVAARGTAPEPTAAARGLRGDGRQGREPRAGPRPRRDLRGVRCRARRPHRGIGARAPGHGARRARGAGRPRLHPGTLDDGRRDRRGPGGSPPDRRTPPRRLGAPREARPLRHRRHAAHGQRCGAAGARSGAAGRVRHGRPHRRLRLPRGTDPQIIRDLLRQAAGWTRQRSLPARARSTSATEHCSRRRSAMGAE